MLHLFVFLATVEFDQFPFFKIPVAQIPFLHWNPLMTYKACAYKNIPATS